jgi:diguanylate cyclase (GGDEF)-like protein/PAS domain S-box-containing protein
MKIDAPPVPEAPPNAAPVLSSKPQRALIVEDMAADAQLISLRLAAEGLAFDWHRVQTEKDYLAELARRPDIILADWHLPQFSGKRALELLGECGLDIPFIIVSGGIGEEAAIDAMRQGAADYVLKDRPARLGAAVRRALEERRLRGEQKEADEKLRQAAKVFESTSEGIILTDLDGDIVAVNRAFTDITGYAEAEVMGRNPRLLQSGRHDVNFYFELWSGLLNRGVWQGEIWNRRKSGEVYPQWLTLSMVKDAGGAATHYVGVFSDISQVKDAQSRLDFLAHHDPLTRLPNRTLLHDRLDHGLQQARRDGAQLALLFLDLDRFKNVNDTLGHPVGDEMLQSVAQRINEEIRAGDTLARLGGDEFVLLLESDADAHGAALVARKLLDLFAAPQHVGGHELVITASIGISLYPGDGEDADTLLKNADRAMYEAKSRGRNTYQFFEPSLSAGVLERLVMESALRGALGRRELMLHYQPQVDLRSRALVGVEALARWQHPELGTVSPVQFIPLAEEMGIIGEIGAWVLKETCRQLVDWEARGWKVPRAAVNLSVQQVEREVLVTEVSTTLTESGLDAHRLELEVTESMIMRQPEQAQEALRELMNLGVQLALDDFGTGYSSMAYLKRLSLHRLKIDQSFVRDIGRDSRSEAIIRAVIALARGLRLETVAEGVEEEHQAAFLEAAGCDVAQGYLFSRPVPPEEVFTTWSGRPVSA